MKVSELWREEVEKRNHYSQYDKDEFIQILNTRCPDWKEQIKDEAIWPELHSYGANVRETMYLAVFLEELGLKFACYLMEHPDKGILDSACAADYCSKHIATHWAEFPDKVKSQMLNGYLPTFLSACRGDISLWKSLSASQKKMVLDRVKTDEPNYVSDYLLFLMWAKELNFRDAGYLVFATEEFRRAAEMIIRDQEREPRREDYFRRIEHRIANWDIPRIIVHHVAVLAANHRDLEYVPSKRLQTLIDVAKLAGDEESLAVLEKVQRAIEERFILAQMMY